LPILFKFLLRLDPQPDYYVFSENNSKDNTFELIKDFHPGKPKKIIRLWFRPEADKTLIHTYEKMAHIRQLLLTAARNLDVDYAFFLDADVIPLCSDMILRFVYPMRTFNIDVLGGSILYFNYDGSFCLSASCKYDEKHYYRVPIPQRSYDLFWFREVDLVGAAALCLSRRVVQDRRVNFYPLTFPSCEDGHYCFQAQKHGYKIFLEGWTGFSHLFWLQHKKLRPWYYNVSLDHFFA